MTGDRRAANARDDYETPQWLVARVRKYFGGAIQLDPATTPRNPAGASRWYTDVGLVEPWVDGTYCNPPYGSALPHWVDKALSEGVHTVMLTPARFGSRWFRRLTMRATAVALLDRRLQFTINGAPVLDSKGKPTSAMFDVALTFLNGYEMHARRCFVDVSTFWRQV